MLLMHALRCSTWQVPLALKGGGASGVVMAAPLLAPENFVLSRPTPFGKLFLRLPNHLSRVTWGTSGRSPASSLALRIICWESSAFSRTWDGL